MKNIIISILLLQITPMTSAQDKQTPAHHTDDGFRNPWPTYSEHGFSDFVKWKRERSKSGKSQHPDSLKFEFVPNDGSFLRDNSDRFTVTWISHSTILFQIGGLNILTDPMWSDRASPVQWFGPQRYTPPALKIDDLPPIDVVVISHDHFDHLDKSTIKQLGNRPHYFVPLRIGNILNKWGIDNWTELDWWESAEYREAEFSCVPSQHFSARSPFGSNRTLWCGWVIKSPQADVCFIGDSGWFPGFKEIGDKYGPFDLAALPIGAYLPKWFMSPVHVDPSQALDACFDLRADRMIAHHWGTFGLADDSPGLAPKMFREEVSRRKLDPAKFFLLRHGETQIIELPER